MGEVWRGRWNTNSCQGFEKGRGMVDSWRDRYCGVLRGVQGDYFVV